MEQDFDAILDDEYGEYFRRPRTTAPVLEDNDHGPNDFIM